MQWLDRVDMTPWFGEDRWMDSYKPGMDDTTALPPEAGVE